MVSDGFAHPTIFEIETVMSILEFIDQACDVVVLEVGLGGREDATNVIENVLCTIFTSISMEHMQYLGESLSKIAYEKAGIIKQGIPVISYAQEEDALIVLEYESMKKEAELITFDPDHVKVTS